MKGIVDRFEGDIAVIEIDGAAQDFAKSTVSDRVKVGDCVVLVEGKWITDAVKTMERSEKIERMMEDLWEE